MIVGQEANLGGRDTEPGEDDRVGMGDTEPGVGEVETQSLGT